MIKSISVLFLLTVLIAGCGYNPESPAYDTASNPDNFPGPALALINDIQDNTLMDYDSIIARFESLYIQNSEMLDNAAWKKVVDKLGRKFGHTADQRAGDGVAGYTDASSMYLLASFAHPDDKRLRKQARLFSAWREVLKKDTGEYTLNTASGLYTVQQKVALLKRFELGDSLSRAFAGEYLRKQLFNANTSDGGTEKDDFNSLSTADQALLAYAGLTDSEYGSPQAVFTDPQIDLVATRLNPQGSGWYLVEMYFVPKQMLSTDYTIAVRIKTGEFAAAADENSNGYLTFDFVPHTPTSRWESGDVMVAAKRVYSPDELTWVGVGLYDRSVKPEELLPVNDSEENLVAVPLPEQPDMQGII